MSSSRNIIRTPGVQVGGSSNGGGGGGGARNFSYKRIAPDVTVTIPADQQMIVYGEFLNEGLLVNLGELLLLPLVPGGG